MFSSGPYGKLLSYHLYGFSFYHRIKIGVEHIFADTVYSSIERRRRRRVTHSNL